MERLDPHRFRNLKGDGEHNSKLASALQELNSKQKQGFLYLLPYKQACIIIDRFCEKRYTYGKKEGQPAQDRAGGEI